MGERLNVEIFNKGACLANAYYHNSAYTMSAIKLITEILKNINRLKDYEPLQRAIFLLQNTGAGFCSDEIEIAKEKNLLDLQPFQDRDLGIIGLSDKGILNNRYWEDRRVKIFLDEKRIDFDVFGKMHRLDWKQEQQYEYKKIKIEDLPVRDWILSDIKFKDFKNIAKEINELAKISYNFILSEYPLYINNIIE